MDDEERKMIRAARIGDLEELQRLYRDTNVNLNARDPEKHTALFRAARGRHIAVVRWLLENGGDVRIKSESDQTPLHAVCWTKQADDPRMLQVAQALIDHGQDVNSVNRTGHTPLHWASYYGHVELARLLIERGANVSLRNSDGETALDKARKRANVAEMRAVVALLEESGGAPVTSFYGYLFDKTHVDPYTWHDGMVHAIDNVHDTKVFYSILKTSLTLNMISPPEAAACLQKAIVQTARKVTSQETVATYEIFLSKCRKDLILQDDPSFLLLDMTHPNHFPADVKFYVESVVSHSVQQMQDLDMGTSFHDLRQNLQVLCDEMFTLHQYSANDEDLGAYNVISALDDSYLFRMKAQATIIMVMVIVKALQRSVDPSLVAIYPDIVSRIVDFGDIEHIREIISSAVSTEDNNPDVTVLRFEASLQEGINMANRIIIETRNGSKSSEEVDAAMREPDAFFVLGFVATIMNPSNYPPQKKMNSIKKERSGSISSAVSQQRRRSNSIRSTDSQSKRDSSVDRSHSGVRPSRRNRRSTSNRRSAASLSPTHGFRFRSSEKRRPSPAASSGSRMNESPGWGRWGSRFRSRSRSRSRSQLSDSGRTTPVTSHASPVVNTDDRKSAKESPMRFRWRSKSDRNPTPDSRRNSPARLVTPREGSASPAPWDETHSRVIPASNKTFSMSPSTSSPKPPPTAVASPHSFENQTNSNGHIDANSNGHIERGVREVSRSASPKENGRRQGNEGKADSKPPPRPPVQHIKKEPPDAVVLPRELPPRGSAQAPSSRSLHSYGSSERGRSRSRRSGGDNCSQTNGSLTNGSVTNSYTNSNGPLSSRSSGRLIKVYRDAELTEADEGTLELHAAVKFGDAELVQEFLGGDDLTDVQLNALDSCGRTALDLAALTGQIETMTMIESRGGIYSYRNRDRMVKKAKKRVRYLTQYLKLVRSEL
jgi:ankyrin repeat protein